MNKKICKNELLAECLGSMFLLIAAISPTILFTNVFESHISVAVLANAITVAFVLYALIELFGNISGAHFNPLVTMVMAFERKIGVVKSLLFIVVQILGGLAGLVATHLMFFNEIGGLFFVSDIVRSDYIYFAEIIGTFIILFTILMLVKANSSKIPRIIGLLVGGQIMATSSTLFANPQVTIARMFTNSVAGVRPLDGLMFIVMQLVGALLAYAVYKFMFPNKIHKKGEE